MLSSCPSVRLLRVWLHQRLLPFAAPLILVSLRFCVDRLPSWLPHSPWGDSSVTYLFLCWRLPSLSSGPQIEESTCLLGPTECPKLHACNNALSPPSRPLSDQAPRSLTLNSSWSFLLSSQPVNVQALLFFYSWGALKSVLHYSSPWLSGSGPRKVQSVLHTTIRVIFPGVRIKHQSDQFISVLNSSHAFLLIIMVPVPLFSLPSPSYILHPPPAHMLSKATFTSGFWPLQFPLPKCTLLQ